MSREPVPHILSSQSHGDARLPALVLLHGFLGDKQDWQPLLPFLTEHFHCICMDLPGHGDSGALNLPTPGFDACATMVRQTLDALGVEECYLLGYSLGGRIALHLAKQLSETQPRRLLALMLESCHPGLNSDKDKQARTINDEHWANRLETESLRHFLGDWYQQPVFADLTELQRKALISKRAESNPLSLVNCYRATSLALQQDLWDLPQQLSCPVWFFVGDRDQKFSALAQRWHQQSPVSVLTIKNAGHNVHIEQPKPLANAIMEQITMTMDAQQQPASAVSIRTAALHRYHIPLQPTLPVGTARINVRQGLVLSITNQANETFHAEVAPLSGLDDQGQILSGFSQESLEQVSTYLQDQLAALPNQGVEQLLQLSQATPYPSAALGLSLLAAKLSEQLPPLRLPQAEVPLIYFDKESTGDAAADIRNRVLALTANVLRVKVKVGQLPMAQEIDYVHQILAANPRLKLRLDANRAFTLEQALDFLGCLPLDAIEYIEEPCQNPDDNAALFEALGVHYGLDETLNDPDYEFRDMPGLAALVLKPMLLGNLHRLSQLIETAEAHGVRAVLSSALESSLGIADIRRIAAWLTPQESPGVGTLGAFTQGVIEPLADKPTLHCAELILIKECNA